jgi:hypothetical protein
MEKRVWTCVATQWTEFLDALLSMDYVTVPSTRVDKVVSIESMKRAYKEQVTACDLRYVFWLEPCGWQYIRLTSVE